MPRSRWTAQNIPDLTGRTAVVTGANSGIGTPTARELARHGARVLLACRDPEKGKRALERLRAELPGADLELVRLDLADLASVRQAADEITEITEGRLHLLVNNAGVMAVPLHRTVDGFETQFGTNHLGHFALTGLLMRPLLAAESPRVVTVSSMAHRWGRIDFGNLNAEGTYRKWLAYGQSKLANLLFTFELDSRVRRAGVDLTAVAAHPGTSATNLPNVGHQMAGGGFFDGALGRISYLWAQSAEAGALPTLRAATDPQVVGGDYLGPLGPMEARGEPGWVSTTTAARDRETARRLWEVSEKLTGVTFPAF
ncbi:oxidoreductase [Allostreptomyces psammosilenae]|uniref:NAD(P)-dependent dehydrogenase (Short-subunit alcohol dehydrogenase family) n=1 Tax=Allostreptomyces psammosilenae TaxID=1892865 RepID=A0A852ZZ07_9ACTN|nr:oxidoreductase [Allostreptomyces psammosilenae]NYI03348.1 NAD(P)-dependent dehydrogenase (short-subunit alcohol dehydrogenase family) [Allostreptomyces psammosilenae]